MLAGERGSELLAMTAPVALSIVIPTLNAADTLPACLAALAPAVGTAPGGPPRARIAEMIVADGGSRDGSRAVARRFGARVLRVPPGRGRQLRAGAAAAKGDWLLFLHADTVLGAGWAGAAARFAADPGNARRAAAFRFALDDRSPGARRMERLVAWRCRALRLPFGDQGLLIGRALYDELGGFRPLPLMEDVDLVRRIGPGRLALLDAPAVTSAARYRSQGYWLRPLRNLALLGLYFLGVPPRLLVRLYA
jgi:rSAM/selenodomain-associated transferase 2